MEKSNSEQKKVNDNEASAMKNDDDAEETNNYELFFDETEFDGFKGKGGEFLVLAMLAIFTLGISIYLSKEK